MIVSVTAARAVWHSIFCLVILVKFSSTQNVNTSIPTDPPEVTTIYGRVLGSTTVINGTANVDVFLGVPYAQPPIGKYLIYFGVEFLYILFFHLQLDF